MDGVIILKEQCCVHATLSLRKFLIIPSKCLYHLHVTQCCRIFVSRQREPERFDSRQWIIQASERRSLIGGMLKSCTTCTFR